MKKQKLAKVSPWLLAAACSLLAIIISVFAVNNYKREKELMTQSLLQQGMTIARFVTSSSRTSLRGNIKNIRLTMWQWTEHVQQAIDNSIEQPDLIQISLIHQDGTILASSDSGQKGEDLDQATFQLIQELFTENTAPKYAFRKIAKKSEAIFQLAVPYYPFGQKNFIPRIHGRGFRFWMQPGGPGDYGGPPNRDLMEMVQDIRSKKYTLLVELDMSGFNSVVQRQLIQIISLSMVLLLVGTGGWLSLLTLQGLKGSQIRLKQISQFTDMLVSSLPVGLIATDNNGNIRIFNTSAEEMVGMQAADVIGRDPHKILPQELSIALQQEPGMSVDIRQREILINSAEGKSRALLLTALPVVDSRKQYAGDTLLIQDLSQIKELQRELRRNERLAALGKMAAGVAHELRNPLSSIKGLALLLKSKVGRESQGDETAELLIQEVERLNRSIGELLDYARPHKLKLERMQLSDVLEKAVTLIAADAQSAGIEIVRDFAQECMTSGDRDKLSQVFLNLLLNSIQAMDRGGRLEIRVFVENSKVISQVKDNGCGLDMDSVTKVFDPYFTTKKNGTGLGLAMSAKIIEEHRGTMEFSSAAGVGTTVKVILPAAFAQNS